MTWSVGGPTPKDKNQLSVITKNFLFFVPHAHAQKLIHGFQQIEVSAQICTDHRDGHRCTRCHRSADEVQMTVAHIIAHADGGRYTPDNLRLRCIDCHMNNEIGRSNRLGARLLRGIKRRG